MLSQFFFCKILIINRSLKWIIFGGIETKKKKSNFWELKKLNFFKKKKNAPKSLIKHWV